MDLPQARTFKRAVQFKIKTSKAFEIQKQRNLVYALQYYILRAKMSQRSQYIPRTIRMNPGREFLWSLDSLAIGPLRQKCPAVNSDQPCEF